MVAYAQTIYSYTCFIRVSALELPPRALSIVALLRAFRPRRTICTSNVFASALPVRSCDQVPLSTWTLVLSVRNLSMTTQLEPCSGWLRPAVPQLLPCLNRLLHPRYLPHTSPVYYNASSRFQHLLDHRDSREHPWLNPPVPVQKTHHRIVL